MGIQSQTLAFLKANLSQFDAETITIGATNISAVINEVESSNMLGGGAKRTERSLTVQFAADAYASALRSGQAVTARGQTWQISAEPGAIRKGIAAITLLLVEPERRSDY